MTDTEENLLRDAAKELNIMLRFSMAGGRIIKTYVATNDEDGSFKESRDAWLFSIYTKSLTAKNAWRRQELIFIGDHERMYPHDLDSETMAFMEKHFSAYL